MLPKPRGIWMCTLILPLAIACGGNNTGTEEGDRPIGGSAGATDPGSVGTGGAGGDRPVTNSGARDPRRFVAAMLADGQSEVAVSRLASERAANAQVKAFAQRVAADHAQANDELTELASRLTIKADPPDPAHQSAQDRLSGLKGAAFDREYVNAMVTSHQAAVDQLSAMRGGTMADDRGQGEQGRTTGSTAAGTRDAASASSDRQAVQAWAAKVTPIMQAHLQQARELQGTVGSRDTDR